MTLSIAASSSGRAGRMTRPSGKRDVRGVFLFHADGVVSRVDMMRFARNARREVAEEIERRAAHIVDRDVAAQRGVMLVPFEDQAEIAAARCSERLDRPRGDQIGRASCRERGCGKWRSRGLPSNKKKKK